MHRWIWSDPGRRAHKLLRFSETEIDGGRDILRASETTSDPLLRRLYLLHASDETRHGRLFRGHASTLLRTRSPRSVSASALSWGTPAGHGLDDLRVEEESDETMLAFLHVAEKDAAARFAFYRDAVLSDPPTRAIFEEILHDEKFHMNYTLTQLVRVSPERHRRQIWYARLNRLWKAYLRLAAALGGAIGTVVLTIQYFLIVPLFAIFAKRAERRERRGWKAVAPERNGSLTSQY
ncbi:MAG TPA: ferritin-like domain-containing protein [Thermoanaerobaculia bacterium]|nr:ferritin-like domain-containing protein [Thermoanaerobaculia bacterium]